MPSQFQLDRIGEAWKVCGRHATAKQIWRFLQKEHPHSPGFKGRAAVSQILSSLKKRR